MTIGAVAPLKNLWEEWNGRVEFVDVLVRQAHPGPGVEPYVSYDEKLQDARAYQQVEGIPWTVLVDDLEGTVHRAYGGLADPTYILDTDGRVSFYNMWTHPATLHEALTELMEQGARGVVAGGVDATPHLLAAMTEGWRAIRRGLPQSYVDLELASPGAGAATWLGYQLRPVLAPLAHRSEPLPGRVRAGLAVGAVGLVGLGLWMRRRGYSSPK